MAVSPRLAAFRALLTAHAQTSWNRSVRELGRQGVVLMVFLTALVGLLGILPVFAGMGALGWVVGGNLHKPLVPALLGLVLTLVSLGGGLFGGVLGGARQLSWEAYRGYPLKLRTLYVAELMASLGDPLPLMLGIALTAFTTGLAVGSPILIPLLPMVWLETLLTLLALQLLVGGLAAALVKRLRVALTVVAVLAWMGSTLATGQLPSHKQKPNVMSPTANSTARIEAMGRRGAKVLSFLPSQGAVQSLLLIKEGRWSAALAWHAYPLAILAGLMVLGAGLVGREAQGDTVMASRGPDRLWTFRSPVAGLGRLHFHTLMASQLGRFAFLMPVMTLVLLKGPFAQLRGHSLWAVPAAFAYLSLVGNNVMLNQFGFDRHGIKTLLLLPVTAEDLLKGKLLGMAAHQALLALLLVILLAVFAGAGPAPLMAGVLMLGCVFLAQGALGQWTSLWAPRPMTMDSLKNSNLPFGVVMLSLASSGVWTSLFGGTYAFTAWFAPAWLVPVMALAFLLTLAAHLALLPTLAAYLDHRREVLVERLG